MRGLEPGSLQLQLHNERQRAFAGRSCTTELHRDLAIEAVSLELSIFSLADTFGPMSIFGSDLGSGETMMLSGSEALWAGGPAPSSV